jgi:hypothetical protein
MHKVSYVTALLAAVALAQAVAVAQLKPAAPPKPAPPTAATQAKPAAAFAVEPLTSPSTGDSGSPQITVSGDRMVLSWLERLESGATLKFARRTAAGWSAPVVVTSGENVVMNWADVPAVRSLSDTNLLAYWLEKNSPDPEAYDIRLATSADGGRKWNAAVSPHRDGTKTQHGFASFFATGPDSLGLVWLDGRDTAGGKGAMTLRAAKSVAVAGDELVAPRVCDCCPTAAANTADGVVVAFRGRTADEVRDIYVTRYAAGKWTPPQLVNADGWKINGCPINGPAIDARGQEVAVAWFTVVNGAGRAFAAFSSDGGRTFSAPIRVDDAGSTGRVQIALVGDGAAVVSWVELGKGPSELKVRRIARNGMRSAPSLITIGVGTQFPRMAASRGELVFAWTENSRGISRVRTARARL